MSRVLLLLLVVCLFVSGPALACTCMGPPPPEEALKKSDAVFSGTVVKIERMQRNGWQYKRVTFDVHRMWKGKSTPQIAVDTSLDEGACGITFGVGERWLVYAGGSNRLFTGLCGRSTPLRYAEADIKAIRTAVAIESLRTNARWFGLVLFSGALCALLLLKRKKAGSKVPDIEASTLTQRR